MARQAPDAYPQLSLGIYEGGHPVTPGKLTSPRWI